MISTLAERPLEKAVLVRAAQGGDRSAFGALYEQYARMVHGILLAHVPYHEAEDLVQDVFIRAMQQLRSLRNPEAFGSWLAAIARRAAMDLHRKRKLVLEAKEQVDRTRSDDESFVVLGALKTLPKAYRETLILRLLEGMTGPEIAQRTGLKAESVRVNLCRGMKLLRRALGGGSNHE